MPIQKINITPVDTLEELRRATENTLNQLVDRINAQRPADIDANGGRIQGVGKPAARTDAVNKEYVDQALASQRIASVRDAVIAIGTTTSSGTPPPNQITSTADFTLTTGTPSPDAAGIPYQPYTLTIVNPPSDLPDDAYLSLFAYVGNDPATDEPVKIGLNYANPWSNIDVTSPMTVWFQQDTTTPTIYLFPVIQSKSADFLFPDASFIHASVTIPSANVVYQVASSSDFTAVLGTDGTDQSGKQFQQVIVTITSPPAGLPSDAFAGLWSFNGTNPATADKFLGDGGPPWFNAAGVTGAHEVWFPMGTATETVHLFPTINTKTYFPRPTSSFAHRSLVIPANTGFPAPADPTQFGTADWSISETQFTQSDGKQWSRLSIVVSTVPGGLPPDAYPSLRLFDGADPATASPIDGSGGPVWNWINFTNTMEVWVERQSTNITAYAFLTICSKTTYVPPDVSFASHTVTITALSVAAAPSAFLVGVSTSTDGGVPVGKFVASMVPAPGSIFYPTANANIKEYLVERVPTNSSFVPVTGQPYVPIFHVADPAWTTGVIADYATNWPLPGSVEYWTFRCIPVYLDDTKNLAAITYSNVTVPAATGLDFSGVNTSTLDTTLALVSGKVGVKGNSLSSTFFANGAIGADLAKFAAGTTPVNYFAGLPTLGTGLPQYPAGSILVNLSDGKVYRTSDGLNWDKGVSPGDLVAGTIAAGVIYAGTIQATQMVAGTMSAGVVYSGTINANQINAGTLNAFTITAAAVSGSTITSISGTATAVLSNGTFIGNNNTGQVARISDGQIFSNFSALGFGFDSTGFVQTNSSGVEKLASAISGGNGLIRINGVKVLGVQQTDYTAITLAPDATTLNAIDGSGNLYNNLLDLYTRMNANRTVLRNHGLMA